MGFIIPASSIATTNSKVSFTELCSWLRKAPLRVNEEKVEATKRFANLDIQGINFSHKALRSKTTV